MFHVFLEALSSLAPTANSVSPRGCSARRCRSSGAARHAPGSRPTQRSRPGRFEGGVGVSTRSTRRRDLATPSPAAFSTSVASMRRFSSTYLAGHPGDTHMSYFVSCKRAITQFLVVLDMLICIDHLKDIKKMHTLLTAMACITSISNSTYSTGTSFNIFVCPRENKNKKEARTSACKCLGAISSDWSLSTNQESFFPRFPRKFVRMLSLLLGREKKMENGGCR